MKSVTIFYKVFGCNDEGKPILYAEFLDLKEACQYAVSKQGKIHYGLPEIEKHIYTYDTKSTSVSHNFEKIEPAQIYYMNKI